MRLCSYDLTCQEFAIDFVTRKDQELYKLYKNDNALASYFTIPGSKQNYLEISLPKSRYDEKVSALRQRYIMIFLLTLIAVALLSAFFALYALSPLRNALSLTEEFIKDILHDFNTPLTTLRLNLAILQSKHNESRNIQRAQNAIETLLRLQSNLRAYLHTNTLQKEEFYLDTLLQDRIDLLASSYKDITIEQNLPHKKLFCNKDAFVRIFDNIFSNALKYNKQNGSIHIAFENDNLIINDSGKGIKDTKKIFDRFYKEQDRGIGIGLHIVKKLCDELGVKISVQSEMNKGTKFSLDLSSTLVKQP